MNIQHAPLNNDQANEFNETYVISAGACQGYDVMAYIVVVVMHTDTLVRIRESGTDNS